MWKFNRNVTQLVTLPALAFSEQKWEPETERTGRALLEADCYLRPRSPLGATRSLAWRRALSRRKMPQYNKWHFDRSLSFLGFPLSLPLPRFPLRFRVSRLFGVGVSLPIVTLPCVTIHPRSGDAE